MIDTVYGAAGHTDDGEPWEVLLLADGRVVGYGPPVMDIRFADGDDMDVTPTGPFFRFDAGNAAHIRWLLERRYGGIEDESGTPPGEPPPPIPPLPPGAIG